MKAYRPALLIQLFCVALTSACAEPGCELEAGAHELLGGGPAVCLGESFSAVQNRIPGDSDASLPGVSVREGDALYSYQPGGGIDLVAWVPFARVVRACVTADSAGAAGAWAIADRARIKLGGSWRAQTEPEAVTWIRGDGVLVSARTNRPFTTCVQIKH
jgi:hypothetical protein